MVALENDVLAIENCHKLGLFSPHFMFPLQR